MEIKLEDAITYGFEKWLYDIKFPLQYIEEIGKLLDFVEEHYPSYLEEKVGWVKERIQTDAFETWKELGSWGLLAMATGTGKSRVAIEAAKYITPRIPNYFGGHPKICLIVPTEKLRDENWEVEFRKWDGGHIYDQSLSRYCYASIANIEGKEFDLVIADEGHNITANNSVFFKRNKIKRLMVLSATPPSDPDRVRMLKTQLALKLDYLVTVEQAIRLRMVANYEMKVVECTLDSSTKNIPAGTKDKPFLNTERADYNYKSSLINKSFGVPGPKGQKLQKMRRLARRHLLKNLPSMTKNIKFILENFITPDERVLIFCGSIPQANEVSPYAFHSKTKDTWYHAFKEGKISELACVNALNEGENLNDVTTILVVVPDSDDKKFIQQIGRSIRFKIGHVARVIVLIVVDTASEEWFEEASKDFDKSKMTRVRMANLESGNIKTL